MTLTERHPDRPGFRPLYQQVRDLLLARIVGGVWRPAEALPSEQTLAAELGVSQGTVRKALDSLATENLVARRQGKGTYVAEHTPESAQFRFFKVSYPSGARTVPTCPIGAAAVRRTATPGERGALKLESSGEIVEIRRDRHIDGAPALRERIVVPALLFPGLESRTPLPNTLYTLYQSDYGVSIVSASEQMRAVAATREDADALSVNAGDPMMQVDRIALDIADRAVELRESRFATAHFVYAVELR